MATKKFDVLFHKALKQAAKSTREYDPKLNRETRVPAPFRPLVKQRAKWETMEEPKRGQHVYLKYQTTLRPVRDLISQLSKADIKKWEKAHFEPSLLEREKVGKIVFEQYRDVWHHHPVDRRGESTRIKIMSVAGDIIRHFTIDMKDHSIYSIKREMERVLGEKPNDMRHYKAIVAEAERMGMPQRFTDDLFVHDKHELKYKDPSLPFGWVLRMSGTHIIDPYAKSNGEDAGGLIKALIGFSSSENTTFYIWSGNTLKKTTPEHMRTWLNRLHQR